MEASEQDVHNAKWDIVCAFEGVGSIFAEEPDQPDVVNAEDIPDSTLCITAPFHC